MSRFWNFIKNQDSETQPGSVELRIDGDIVSDNNAWLYEWFGEQSTSPNAFREELGKYANQDLTVWINSNGGDVFAATGIYDALKNHKGKITTRIEIAMSAASVIAMAGDEILMSPVGVIMMHNPLSGARGYASDLRKQADVLDVVKDTIINAYAARTNKSRSTISAMMDDETWMSANVAVKEGFVDKILFQDDEKVENIFNLSFNRFAITNNANESIKKLIDFDKLHNKVIEDNLETEKEKLLMELDLI
ncbi:head maturation protease, ClpP-related [Bacillus sp. SCS-151]|uniref:head maturation protease, ClpP-related n=1 Tax=Nanhaiella sioensis TaxID=3115293 RepID=UPI003978986C